MTKKTNKKSQLDIHSHRKNNLQDKVNTPREFDFKQECNKMPEKLSQETDENISCDFCARWCDTVSKESTTEALPGYFMTEREFSALADMRRIKAAARNIKKQMGQIEESLGDYFFLMDAQGKISPEKKTEPWIQAMSEEWILLSQRLDCLRELWKEKDRERIAAAEERMRLLGHIQ